VYRLVYFPFQHIHRTYHLHSGNYMHRFWDSPSCPHSMILRMKTDKRNVCIVFSSILRNDGVWRRRGTFPCILKLGSRWRSVIRFSPQLQVACTLWMSGKAVFFSNLATNFTNRSMWKPCYNMLDMATQAVAWIISWVPLYSVTRISGRTYKF